MLFYYKIDLYQKSELDMPDMYNDKNDLFVYGTLKEEDLLKEIIGRIPEMLKASVEGYRRFFDIDIGYYSAMPDEWSLLEGVLLKGLTSKEIQALDRYEGIKYGLYRRIEVQVTVDNNSAIAFIYVKGKNFKAINVDRP
jgi:gamma-glutamylcyclotransferase (GGCT)/AIG2-like uncharacterized protein YtfP